MPWSETLYPWVIHCAIVSLLVLAIGSIVVLVCRRPARRAWLIELVLAGCLIAPWMAMIPGYPRLKLRWPQTLARRASFEVAHFSIDEGEAPWHLPGCSQAKSGSVGSAPSAEEGASPWLWCHNPCPDSSGS